MSVFTSHICQPYWQSCLSRDIKGLTGPLLFFLFCCPFVPPFSSVCCTTQQPLYCVLTLTTNLQRPLWVNRWFQPYLVLRNEQLESKQSQVKTYPIIQVSNSKLTNLWSKEEEYFRILSARNDTYLHVLFVKHLRSVYETIPPHPHKTIQKLVLIHIWERGNAFQCILRFWNHLSSVIM